MNRDRDSKWDFKGNRPYYRPGELIPKKVWDSMDDVEKEYYQEEARKIHEEREIAREEFDKRLAEEKRKREERNKPVRKLLRLSPLYFFYWVYPIFTCRDSGYFGDISCSTPDIAAIFFVTPFILHFVWKIFKYLGVAIGFIDKDIGPIGALLQILLLLAFIYIWFEIFDSYPWLLL